MCPGVKVTSVPFTRISYTFRFVGNFCKNYNEFYSDAKFLTEGKNEYK